MASRTAASRSTNTRASRKTATAGAAQAANAGALAQTQTSAPQPQGPVAAAPAGSTNGAPPQTNDAALKMPHIQHAVLVNSIKAVTAGFKAAINLEVAVACAVFIDAGDTGTAAKKELYSVYKDAGYDCAVGGEGKDYKTVNRRIGYAATFYDSLEKDALKNVMGEARDEAAIQTLVAHIAGKYNFRTMSDVQEASGVVPASRQPRNTGNAGGSTPGGSASAPAQQGPQQPAGGAGVAPQGAGPDAGDKGVMAALAQAGESRVEAQARREFDDSSKWMKFTFEGATVIVPTDMKTECLADLGIKLMTAAKEMHGANTVIAAVLNETFKEAVAAH